jgi:hypothetical protein
MGSSRDLKPGFPAVANSVSKLVPLAAKICLAYVELDPSGGFERWMFIVRKEGILRDFGVADDVPPIAGEIGAVNDESADGSFARGLLEFIGPAAVIGEGLTAEEVGIVGGRIVNQAENDLTFDLDAGIVIPVELRRRDAVADPYDGGVERDRRREFFVEDNEVIGEFELDGRAGFGQEGEGGLYGISLDAGEVDLLEVGAVVAAGSEPVAFELGCDELCSELATAPAGIAAFEEIVGKVFVIGAIGVRADGGLRGNDRGWQGSLGCEWK